MFVVEFVFGILARSTSLLADSADMFGDAIIYGGSFLVVGKSTLAKAKVSFAKGLIMLLVGMGALYEAISKWITHSQPDPETMGIVGALALVANLTCAVLLMMHRDDDINMKSTWICSRNDVLTNIGVVVAAGLVAYLNSALPDIIVGSAIAGLVLHSSYGILKESRHILATEKQDAV